MYQNPEKIVAFLQKKAPAVDFWSIRFVTETKESLTCRQNVFEPVSESVDTGVMVTVFNKGGSGYAATSSLDEQSLEELWEKAKKWAQLEREFFVFDSSKIKMPSEKGSYETPGRIPSRELSFPERMEYLKQLSQTIKKYDTQNAIVDWHASSSHLKTKQYVVNSNGAHQLQDFSFIYPDMGATAFRNGVTQSRSLCGRQAFSSQGFCNLSEHLFFHKESARKLADEALELASAPNCPEGTMDLVLGPDQMMLQIHESIGHPLELDRILGDERNYAGTSFVTLDMFGSYQYGSKLLNVTFDPTHLLELASYNFDDDGAKADKVYLIKNGILQTPLGGTISQQRAHMPGVSNSRACNWNRPPIDRMANLNVEPGTSTLEEIISSVEKGIYMESNTSWSIDDSRNKFQFGCEWARLIENGSLTKVVRNPNYRGISSNFWRNLKMVGDASTSLSFGTPMCGKGEPNQVIRVGHASPVCLFSDVDVFGGAK